MNARLYATVAGLGIVAAASADDVELSTLPQAVQTTIQQYVGDGVVDEIEQELLNGRTVYEVEIERGGDDHEIWVDADGTLLAQPPAQGVSGLFQKGDGKILGIPVGDRDDADSDQESIAEDVFDKNDGKLADILPAPSGGRGNIETDVEAGDHQADLENDLEKNRQLKVKADADLNLDDEDDRVVVAGDRPDFKNPPVRNQPLVVEEGSIGARNRITTDQDGGLDTDDGDGRILGVPKRVFETLPLSKVPDPVRQTIRREARGHRVAEIELANKDGIQVYEVDVEKDGLNRELQIAADGRIIDDSENEAVGAPAGSESGTESDR